MAKLEDLLEVSALRRGLDAVRSGLDEAVGSGGGPLGDLTSHLARSGGKLLRPVLVLAAARPADADIEVTPEPRVVTAAVAVEVLHLGTLYHDDVTDEGLVRRGAPTVNARWGNIVAVLGGDVLLARAVVLASRLGQEEAALLAATLERLCAGQSLELSHLHDRSRTAASYSEAIAGKTASLMALACRLGGMEAGLEQGAVEALALFGHHFGIAYQIADDLLDVVGDDDALRKPAGNDLAEGVYTLPVLFALQESAELRALLGRPLAPGEVTAARRLVIAGDGIRRSTHLARAHVEIATAAVQLAPGVPPQAVSHLTAIADAMLDRLPAIAPASSWVRQQSR